MTCAKVCTNPGRSFEMIVRTISTGITNSYCNCLISTSIRKAYTVLVTFNTVRMELPSWPNPVCLHCSVDARRQISRAIRRDPVGYAAPLRGWPTAIIGCPHMSTLACFASDRKPKERRESTQHLFGTHCGTQRNIIDRGALLERYGHGAAWPWP